MHRTSLSLEPELGFLTRTQHRARCQIDEDPQTATALRDDRVNTQLDSKSVPCMYGLLGFARLDESTICIWLTLDVIELIGAPGIQQRVRAGPKPD